MKVKLFAVLRIDMITTFSKIAIIVSLLLIITLFADYFTGNKFMLEDTVLAAMIVLLIFNVLRHSIGSLNKKWLPAAMNIIIVGVSAYCFWFLGLLLLDLVFQGSLYL